MPFLITWGAPAIVAGIGYGAYKASENTISKLAVVGAGIYAIMLIRGGRV